MRNTLDIAIAGAGIGGLTVAALLADQGHRVSVFDQFETPKPVGSGLVIQPVGQAVLDQLGAGNRARSLGTPIKRMLGHETNNNRNVLNVWYDKRDQGRYGLAIHRASLFDAIYAAAKTRDISFYPGSRVTGRGGQSLTLDRGQTTAAFDLIIAAAGAASPLSSLQSKPLPYGAIWGTVDWPDTDLPMNQLTQAYRKANRMIGALPIGQLPGDETEKAAIFWSMPRDGRAAWKDAGLAAWKAEATALWPAFGPFADQITDPEQMTMARYSHGTMKQPWSPGLVHIGDAAHRASPQLGQGANMALLDAMALAKAMDHATGDAALALYTHARRWHVRVYQGMSAAFTPQYQSDSRWLPVLRDRILYPISQIPPGPKLLTSIVCGTMLPPIGKLTKR